MPAPAQIVGHFREVGYHPRSNVHGKILCEFVLLDLLAMCPKVADHAAAGRLVYDTQRKIIVAGSEWNIDLVLGPPASGLPSAVTAKGIQQAPPATVRIAVEAKTVMTEHGKARRNRQISTLFISLSIDMIQTRLPPASLWSTSRSASSHLFARRSAFTEM